MLRKHIIVFCLLFAASAMAFGQQSLDHREPKVMLDNAKYLMAANNYGGAREYFEKYLATGDTTYLIEAKYNKAICGLKLYHLDGEKLMSDFILEYPTSPLSSRAYIDMGSYFFQDRNYKEAIVYLDKVDQKALSKDIKAKILYELAYSYFATKKFNKALSEFNKVKKGKSKYGGPAHYYAGFVEYDKGDYPEALKDYLAIQNNKAFATSVPYMITSIHYKAKDYKAVISYTKPIIDNNKKVQQKGQMAILLAEAYYLENNYEEAFHYYGIAENSVKFTAQSVYHYGVSSAKSGSIKKAIKLLKPVAGQNNKVGTFASYELGKLYLNGDNNEFAFTAFKSVIDSKHVPELREESSFTAGKLAYELGRFSESISILTDFRNKYRTSQYAGAVDDILAQAFLNTHNYKPALDYIEGLDNKSNTVWQAYQQATFHYGVDFYNNRNFAQAIIYFNKSLEHPILKDYILKANLWIGESYAIGRKYKTALPFYNAAVGAGKNTGSADFYRAVYGRGYAYYNTAQYQNALTDFNTYVKNVSHEKTTYGDALVRLADCYYVTKDYQSAIRHFNEAIRAVITEKDYAYYQAGVVYGILENDKKANDYFERVINVYSSSAYYDDALFEKGLLQLRREEFQKAILTFDMLRKQKPRSPYIAFALERSAVASFNLQNYSQTITLYKELIRSFPNNPTINDALIGLQEAMALEGKDEDFNVLLKDFRAKNPNIEGLEKVEFQSLKTLYNNEQYAKASRGLAGYLASYPEDVNAIEVKYLLAESLFRLDMPDSAVVLYKQLYHTGGEIRVHRIVERIADIEFKRQHYQEANNYYSELAKVAVSNNQKLRAWRGLMDGHFSLAAYDSTLYYIDLLLENGGNRNDFIVAATLKKGKALLNLGQFDNALLNFEKTTQLATDKNGAEAQYYIGVILNQQKDYNNSNDALYILPERYGIYDNWMAKGFLLVGENFIALKEYYQAKATLQSIIDNSDDENTVQIAKNRLEWVINEETKESNIIPDSLNTVEIDTSSNKNE